MENARPALLVSIRVKTNVNATNLSVKIMNIIQIMEAALHALTTPCLTLFPVIDATCQIVVQMRFSKRMAHARNALLLQDQKNMVSSAVLMNAPKTKQFKLMGPANQTNVRKVWSKMKRTNA